MKVIPIPVHAGITGFESPAAQYKELGLSLDELLVRHPNATFIGLAAGDSMQGVGIYDGDLLLVDRAVIPKHMDVIVANYNGEFVCKLVDTQSGLLHSASSQYAPMPITDADSFQLEGTVVSSIRLHKHSAQLAQCLR